ncbi:MAG TPA: hypothetical protein VG820_13800, partial [Fimbriimonadaceae bacterium]|nr:hypothetical protein [Fimbriimonadaceae bacterium]
MRPVIFCIALFALALVRTPGDLFRDQERQGLYDWFDSLGYVSLKDAPFVRIEHWQTDGSKRSLSYSDYGFLKRGEGKSFEALTVELRDVAAVDGKPVGTDPYDDLDVVPADLQGWLAEQKRQWGTDHASRLGLGTADGFVLARLADLRGYRDLADFFYNASRTEPSYGETGMTFPQRVQEGIASSLFWDASSGFRQKALSRSDLAAEFKFIADHFPSSKRRDQASQIVAGLETMIQEDAVRKPLTDAELKKLTPAQQAAELVWQLRNQVADQYMEPGYTEVFPLGRVDGVSPAGKLVKLGPTAIPALLDALHDKRYIRACQGGMRTNRTVLRIRDAAIQVLDKIALRSFSNSPEGVMGDDDKTAALIERHAREWWATMQRLGPRKMMIRAIERGDYESASQAEVFAKSYPKDALATIRVGVAAAKDTYVRQQLIGALSTVDSPAVRAFAGEQMKAGKDLETRVAAARVVAIRDPAGAIRAMAREWANLPPSDSFSHWDIDSLRSFLTNVGYASGIETLARDLEKQPVGRRMDVVEDIDDESTWRG